jgi:4-aminobutyrate aminotransferase-like enzyme
MSEEENSAEENNIDHLEFDSPTPLEQDAAQMHEMFKALTKAGFEERQALMLVAFLIEEAHGEGGVNLFFDETFFKEMNKDEEDDGQDS